MPRHDNFFEYALPVLLAVAAIAAFMILAVVLEWITVGDLQRILPDELLRKVIRDSDSTSPPPHLTFQDEAERFLIAVMSREQKTRKRLLTTSPDPRAGGGAGAIFQKHKNSNTSSSDLSFCPNLSDLQLNGSNPVAKQGIPQTFKTNRGAMLVSAVTLADRCNISAAAQR
jgi:hypothetical protein